MVPMHGLLPPRKRQRHKLQQRSHSMQPDTSDSRATQEFSVSRTLRSSNDAAVNDADDDVAIEGIIAIQIIQPTPNISPTCSLKSVDDDDVPPGLGEQQPLLASSSPSPTSSLKRKKPRHNKVDRRVSFSDDSMDQDDGSGEGTSANHRTSPSHRAIVQQQMQVGGGAATNIPFMNYLQVPGQQPTIQFVAPQLTQEARQAQTSPQARRRRATRLLKAGSFCSITSDGDGDIFGPTGELLLPSGKTDKRPSLTPSQASKQSSADSSGDTSGNTTQKSTFDLSDYTELHLDDCRSDISELFAKNDDEDDDTKGELKNQNTLSEQGSIKSLSTDEDEKEVTVMTGEEDRTEPTVVVSATAGVRRQRRSSPPYNNPEYDEIMRHHATVTTPMGEEGEEAEEGEDMYASSSCSVSIGSDNNAEKQNRNQDHRITVPVTIEHPPPEMREEDEEGSESAGQTAAGDQENRPASTSASLRVETGSPQILEEVVLPNPTTEADIESEEGPVMSEDPEEEVVRLVLVRDIGVQVCGDSPNLNSTRRFPHHRIMPPPRPINVTSDLYPAPPPPLMPLMAAPPSSAPPSSLSGSLGAAVAPSSAPASMTESSFVAPSTLTRRHHRSAGSTERDNSEESFPTEILF